MNKIGMIMLGGMTLLGLIQLVEKKMTDLKDKKKTQISALSKAVAKLLSDAAIVGPLFRSNNPKSTKSYKCSKGHCVLHETLFSES